MRNMKHRKLLIAIESVLFAVSFIFQLRCLTSFIDLLMNKASISYYDSTVDAIAQLNWGGGYAKAGIILMSISIAINVILFIMLLRFTNQKHKKPIESHTTEPAK